MKRLGQPEELAGALLFLLNDEASSFITGTVLPVEDVYKRQVRYVCENVKKCIKVFNNREAAPQQRVFAGYR